MNKEQEIKKPTGCIDQNCELVETAIQIRRERDELQQENKKIIQNISRIEEELKGKVKTEEYLKMLEGLKEESQIKHLNVIINERELKISELSTKMSEIENINVELKNKLESIETVDIKEFKINELNTALSKLVNQKALVEQTLEFFKNELMRIKESYDMTSELHLTKTRELENMEIKRKETEKILQKNIKQLGSIKRNFSFFRKRQESKELKEKKKADKLMEEYKKIMAKTELESSINAFK